MFQAIFFPSFNLLLFQILHSISCKYWHPFWSTLFIFPIFTLLLCSIFSHLLFQQMFHPNWPFSPHHKLKPPLPHCAVCPTAPFPYGTPFELDEDGFLENIFHLRSMEKLKSSHHQAFLKLASTYPLKTFRRIVESKIFCSVFLLLLIFNALLFQGPRE